MKFKQRGMAKVVCVVAEVEKIDDVAGNMSLVNLFARETLVVGVVAEIDGGDF